MIFFFFLSKQAVKILMELNAVFRKGKHSIVIIRARNL